MNFLTLCAVSLLGGIAWGLRYPAGVAARTGIRVVIAIPVIFLIACAVPTPLLGAVVGTVCVMAGVPFLAGMLAGAAVRAGYARITAGA